MYKGNDLINKPIVTFDTGEHIEKVKDVYFNVEQNRLVALIVEEGGIFAQTRILPFANVKAIGPDAITVESASAIVTADTHEDILKNIDTNTVAKGTEVMTDAGENLGTIKDIYFDEKTGTITGYDVSGGMFTDVYEGKSFLPVDKIIKMGKDVVFVPHEVVALMEEQVGGVKGATMRATQKAGTSLKESTAAFPSEKTKENLQQGTEQFKQRANELWENLKSKTSELKGTASSKIEQNKIKNAIGRPVSRVILNEQDEPILNAGEIITHSAIQRARDAGMLDVLLNSVSTETMAYPQSSKATSEGGDGKTTPPIQTDTTINIEKSE